MAAKRLGIETDGALAKVRRVLPDRLRLGVESLEQTLGFTGRDRRRAARRRDAAHARRRRAPRPPVSARYTDSQGRRPTRELTPVRRRRPPAAAGTSPPSTTRATTPRTLRADRIARRRIAGKARDARARRASTPSDFVSRSLASRPLAARDRGPPAHRPRHRARSASRPRSRSSSRPTTGTLLRLRADSLDWAAGLLAGAGCDFTIRHPPRAAGQRETARSAAERRLGRDPSSARAPLPWRAPCRGRGRPPRARP